MGLSSFPNAHDGLLPMLVVSAILVVALLKSTARSLLSHGPENIVESDSDVAIPSSQAEEMNTGSDVGVPVIRRFRSLCRESIDGGRDGMIGGRMEQCCVCLCGFEEEEEVSELRCRHFFHKACLQEWFNNLCCISPLTCPLCRSLL